MKRPAIPGEPMSENVEMALFGYHVAMMEGHRGDVVAMLGKATQHPDAGLASARNDALVARWSA